MQSARSKLSICLSSFGESNPELYGIRRTINPMIGFLKRNNHYCIVGFTYHFKSLTHRVSRLPNRSVRPQIIDLLTFLDVNRQFSIKSIFTTVKWPKIGHILAGSLSLVWMGLKVFVPWVGKWPDRLTNRARSLVGVLDQSLFFSYFTCQSYNCRGNQRHH
jgi:hypothetical protein